MRFIIFIISLVTSIISFAQQGFEIEILDSAYYTNKELKAKRQEMIPDLFINQKKLKWSEWETYLNNEEKDKYLRRLSGNKFFRLGYVIRPEYHLIDFNGDNLLDVIYAGRTPPGGEMDIIAFFENQEDSLRLTLKLLGTIIEIDRESNDSPINFTVWEWPCCAEVVHSIYKYEFYQGYDLRYDENKEADNHLYTASYSKFFKNHHPNFKVQQIFRFITSTDLPTTANFDSEIKFVINTNTAILETKPDKEFEPLNKFGGKIIDIYIPNNYKYNIAVTKAEKGQEGVVINTTTINGEEYLFVKIDCEKVVSELKINDKKVDNLLGWIKSNETK